MLNFNSHEVDLLKADWLLIPDVLDFILGRNIGEGETRTVYDFRMDPTVVVKLERPKDGFNFNNTEEWNIWHNVAHHYPQYKKFLAPCIRISNGGRLLLMKKTTPITKEKMPVKIPYFLSDVKRENWGVLDGRIVCHDYANSRLYADLKKNVFVKHKWI